MGKVPLAGNWASAKWRETYKEIRAFLVDSEAAGKTTAPGGWMTDDSTVESLQGQADSISPLSVPSPAPNRILKVIPCQPLSLSVSLDFLNCGIHLPTATNISWGSSSASSPIPVAWIGDDQRLGTQNSITQVWEKQRRAPMPLPGQASHAL